MNGKFQKRADGRRASFTLVEILVTVAVIALLLAILGPSLSHGRAIARFVKVHAELDGICKALEIYGFDREGKFPPTRCGCMDEINFQLPIELGWEGYLPWETAPVPAAAVEDEYNPGHTYLYRAPGPAIVNRTSLQPSGSSITVPDDFPTCESETYEYHNDPASSPVSYVVYSEGPDPDSPKFAGLKGDPFYRPIPKRFWMIGPEDTGVVTHMRSRSGVIYTSP
jgi:hypothetical protein